MSAEKRVLLGMLTPSSNTVLEPVTTAILQDLDPVSAHFSRFRVTEISLSETALGQFDDRPLLTAAELLADANVDVIAWNGTSAGWLGFERDVHLCDRIQSVTGIPATTSVLALNELFQQQHITRFGLVTPYTADVQSKIVQNYGQAGFDCIAERHLDLSVNFAFSEVTADSITQQVRAVAAAEPQVITTFCTNLRAAPLVADLEAHIGIPIYDTISVVVWKSLILAGADPSQVKGWGQLFTTEAP
ncbi:MAG: Asp/Glu/hydantoin racemase [Leptolyngbya sp. SIOISBB]|nr:Asp/Glu/hydantoin racemase [Leptolyngbya sp. SIOISBB]